MVRSSETGHKMYKMFKESHRGRRPKKKGSHDVDRMQRSMRGKRSRQEKITQAKWVVRKNKLEVIQKRACF